MSFLLDTDTCSAYLKGDRQVWQKMMQYSGRLHVSAITVGELFAWVLRSQTPPDREQQLGNFFGDVAVLDVERRVARKFGEVRADQLDRGAFTPEMDLLIASTALVYELTLVTHNVQDFGHVPGLTVEDWLGR